MEHSESVDSSHTVPQKSNLFRDPPKVVRSLLKGTAFLLHVSCQYAALYNGRVN